MAFERAARLGDIPADRGLRVRLGEVDLGLYRVGEAVYAMEDTCPHAGFPLSRGHFEHCVIVCEAHGWPFDVRTGFAPQDDDGFPIPCFAARVRGEDVEVDLSEQLNDPRKRRATSR